MCPISVSNQLSEGEVKLSVRGYRPDKLFQPPDTSNQFFRERKSTLFFSTIGLNSLAVRYEKQRDKNVAFFL